MKKLQKRVLPSVAAAVAVTGFLVGPGTASASTIPTVTIWSWDAQNAGLWTQVQKQLAAKGEKVNIQFRAINATSYDSVLQTAMDGGQGPDIFYGRAGEGTLDYAAANLIAPVDKIANLNNIASSALKAEQYKGKTYAVPLDIQTMEVFYNKDIFKRYNLSVPKTWNDFIHICQVLKSHNITPLYTMGIQSWMLALNFDEIGASMLGDNFTQKLVNKQAKYSDQPFVDALSKYQSLAPYFEPNFQAVGSAGNEQETQFALGNSAMVMDGLWSVPNFLQDNPKLKLGAFLIPPVNSKQPARIDWYNDADIALNSKISDPAVKKAAEEIIAFTATKQFGQDYANLGSGISPVKGVQISPKYPFSIQAYKWYQTVPINPVFGIRSPMDTPPPTPATSTNKQAASNNMGIFSAEQKVLLPLLTHKLTPKQAADEIQKTVSWYFK
ncbi:MAG: extracellular solute-binding protein [Alicyclobacillus sp.]|nr:extracellular solute-binding protein [Alicyclobacillus sp.]